MLEVGLMEKNRMYYHNLEIWKRCMSLTVKVQNMTINELPKFEMYETGSQIRRSVKSVQANIVEGFGRRRYKLDFLHFLIIAQASLDETINHLEVLFQTGSLKNERIFTELSKEIDEIGKMLTKFIQSVENNHKS